MTNETQAPEGGPVEPVAWRWKPSDVFGEYVLTEDKGRADKALWHGMTVEPLYTRPAQCAAEGALTDEQCDNAIRAAGLWTLALLVPENLAMLRGLCRTAHPQPKGTQDGLREAIIALRDKAKAKFETSTSSGYKLHDLYRMELDAILAAAPTQAPAPAHERTVAERIADAALKRAMGHPVVLEIMADCVSCADTENDAMSDPEFAVHDSAPYRLVEADLRCKAAAIRAEDPEIWPTLEFASPAVGDDMRDAYAGAREDLAIWKRRALEAEELNRRFIADINGQTFMGEPAGMVLVPREATPEMMRAAVVYANGNAVYKNVAAEALAIEESIYGEVWGAMLAASQPPVQGSES